MKVFSKISKKTAELERKLGVQQIAKRFTRQTCRNYRSLLIEKMIINALNSGASTFMADFEDSNS